MDKKDAIIATLVRALMPFALASKDDISLQTIFFDEPLLIDSPDEGVVCVATRYGWLTAGDVNAALGALDVTGFAHVLDDSSARSALIDAAESLTEMHRNRLRIGDDEFFDSAIKSNPDAVDLLKALGIGDNPPPADADAT